MRRHREQIRWIPGFGLDRELDWLRNMGDWMISKKRYWGLALPIWVCDACGTFEVIGGREELQRARRRGLGGVRGPLAAPALGRRGQDRVRAAAARRSAASPTSAIPGWTPASCRFSTLHYHTDPSYWEQWFPADFITESFPGQFRNWFYSLLVMAAALENTPPFKTVLGYATLRDQNGEEMHKSKGNSIPFDEAAEIVGADTMRWLYMNHAPEQNLRFPRIPTHEQAAAMRGQGQPPRLSDLWMQARAPLDKLWNVYSFFVTYANIDNFDPTTRTLMRSERSDLDRWALSELQETVQKVTDALADFDAQTACQALGTFIEDLSNWYVRRSRRRFWKAEEDSDKVAAYLTLYECMVTTTQLLAPITPFLAEALYQNLVRSVDAKAPESVHLCDWPVADAALISPRLHDETALVMRMVNLGRAAREKAQIRVRQPLATLYVRVGNESEREALERLGDQVLEELNVKRLEFLAEGSDMLLFTVQPKMAALGPKLGRLLPKTLATLRSGDMQAHAQRLLADGKLTFNVEGEPVTLTFEDLDVEASAREGFVAAEERGYVALLDTHLTPELLAEGAVRDLTRLIQDARKGAGLAVEDVIELEVGPTPSWRR